MNRLLESIFAVPVLVSGLGIYQVSPLRGGAVKWIVLEPGMQSHTPIGIPACLGSSHSGKARRQGGNQLIAATTPLVLLRCLRLHLPIPARSCRSYLRYLFVVVSARYRVVVLSVRRGIVCSSWYRLFVVVSSVRRGIVCSSWYRLFVVVSSVRRSIVCSLL